METNKAYKGRRYKRYVIFWYRKAAEAVRNEVRYSLSMRISFTTLYIRVSPSGKASDSDSDSTWVRILPPEPKNECASQDVHSFFAKNRRIRKGGCQVRRLRSKLWTKAKIVQWTILPTRPFGESYHPSQTCLRQELTVKSE